MGIQVANWNDKRLGAERKKQIVEALITDINDSISVQRQFVDQIDSGMSERERSYAREKAERTNGCIRTGKAAGRSMIHSIAIKDSSSRFATAQLDESTSQYFLATDTR